MRAFRDAISTHFILALLTVSTTVLVSACAGDDEDDSGSSPSSSSRGGDKGSDSEDGSGDEVDTANLIGASGVYVTQVAMYQGVKRTLMQDGVVQPSAIPLIAGRDAMVRVFYTTDVGYDGAEIFARLELGDGGEPIDVAGVAYGTSNDADLGSSFNFLIPGDRIGATFDYQVGLYQERPGQADNPAARYPSDALESVVVEGPQNTLRVVLAPFAYHADGSGRVPDLGPEQLELYRQRFLQLYPVSNVEMAVREPYPWQGAIQPNGQGWQEVAMQLIQFRGQDGQPEDVYYYAIFNPRASMQQFCGQGCLLGVTLLNNSPPDVGNPQLRLALGVGFPEVGRDTAAHEIGHAHGREHAPCGPGLDPNSIDQSYPHEGGAIGVWGYDIVSQTLVDPGKTDIMGYCNDQWISDHNFIAMFNRGRNVNMPSYHGGGPADVEYELVTLDGSGVAEWQSQVHRGAPLSGRDVTVHVTMESGAATEMSGEYFEWDHLPGGWLFVPRTPQATRLDFELDGMTTSALR